MMRLDKLIAHYGCGTRKDVKKQIRSGAVTVDGTVVKDAGLLVEETQADVRVAGKKIAYQAHRYFLMNKPAGIVSATEDRYDRTVLELLKESDRRNVFPVGRLDKDATGLLLITDDGELAHRLLAPKNHVPKEYRVLLEKPVRDEDILLFAQGFVVDDALTALPATLTCDEEDPHIAFVTICEGKFHQVKRMVAAIDNQVLALQRIRMDHILLDEALPEGTYRALTEEELQKLLTRCHKEL